MNKKIAISLLVVTSVLVFIVSKYFYDRNKAEKMDFLSSTKSELFVKPYSPTLGDKNAKVILVEFLDPECESCRKFYPYVKNLLEKYKGKLRLVVRYVPFHKNSTYAVKILEAARKQGKYWEAMAILFYYQPAWGNHHNPQPEKIWDFLPQAKVDIAQIKRDMESPEIMINLNQDIADAKTLKVRATPTFFVNGKPLVKFGYQYLEDLITQEIDKNYQ